MREMVLLAMIFAAEYLGFGCLALGQSRHWQAVTGTHACPPATRALLRTGGGLLLAAGLMLAVARDGLDYGALVWVTSVTVAAVAVVATLSWPPRWLGSMTRMAVRKGG
ncbi:MAG: hypothetical protein JWQ24_4128 [Tardiphaga sp.]|nr:hypothetical protein [Tardiphaga sp.]